VQDAIDTELRVPGAPKQLPQSRIEEIAADLLVKQVTDPGILWDTTETAFQVQVPASELSRIEKALSDSGMPVNNFTVLQYYRKELARKQAK
jgi:hypothetical protein